MPQAADATSKILLEFKLMCARWEAEVNARKAANEAFTAKNVQLERAVGSLTLLPVGGVTGARVTGARVGSRSGCCVGDRAD